MVEIGRMVGPWGVPGELLQGRGTHRDHVTRQAVVLRSKQRCHVSLTLTLPYSYLYPCVPVCHDRVSHPSLPSLTMQTHNYIFIIFILTAKI